jgi:hypothetical protein
MLHASKHSHRAFGRSISSSSAYQYENIKLNGLKFDGAIRIVKGTTRSGRERRAGQVVTQASLFAAIM